VGRWSPLASGEIPYTAFSFARQIRVAICGELASLFSFCAYGVKRKVDCDICAIERTVAFVAEFVSLLTKVFALSF